MDKIKLFTIYIFAIIMNPFLQAIEKRKFNKAKKEANHKHKVTGKRYYFHKDVKIDRLEIRKENIKKYKNLN